MSSFVAGLPAQWTGKALRTVKELEGFFSQVFARLNYKFGGIIFLLLFFFFFEFIFPRTEFAFTKPTEKFGLTTDLDTTTTTAFTEKADLKTQVLSFKSHSVADAGVALGEQKVVQAGAAGKKVIQTKTIFHNGQKYTSETKVISETKPVDEIVAVNPVVLEKLVQTPYGTFQYTNKLNVWATSYDQNCPGCNSTTAIGLKAGFGVIAVDPKIIPLRSKVYVPGYGIAIAGDTGGSIKGNKIDLGFDNVATGNWSARYTDIYILSE